MNYQICDKCIMDTSDKEIFFNKDGICNHCIEFEEKTKSAWFPNGLGKEKLESILKKIKDDGKEKEYDCLIGLSGGVDSSYLVYKCVEMGLRPLAVHVDAGWNSELAVKNIENICTKLNVDLITIVMDWEEMRSLQIAYLRAGVINQDIPQDHAFVSAIYKFAEKKNIQYIINGSNFATEGILPRSWGYNNLDSKNLRAINKRFGTIKLKKYSTVSFFKNYIYYPKIKKIKVVKLLNFMDYSKDIAMKELSDKLDWQYYGGKHYESNFTKFYQSYYLPKKFSVDKRRAHLSSLIVSGLMSREKALEEIKTPPYNENDIRREIEYVSKKLKMNPEELKEIMNKPPRSHLDFPNNTKVYGIARKILKK